MKKIIAILLVLLSLASIAVFAAISNPYISPFGSPGRSVYNHNAVYGVTRVTHYDPRSSRKADIAYIDTSVYLDQVSELNYKGVGRGGYAPFYARGVARVRSSTSAGLPSAGVTLSTKDLPSSDRTRSMFEGWLVDDETGYRLSIGTFTTGFGGVGEIKYNARNYFDAYDRIEITMEPFDDLDVRPGPVILSGSIAKPVRYGPVPRSSRMLTQSVSVLE